MNRNIPVPGQSFFQLHQDINLVDLDACQAQGWRCWGVFNAKSRITTVPNPSYFNGYQRNFVRPHAVTIPAGTVFKIQSYRSSGNLLTSHVSLLVVDSPDRDFLPKSRGGTGRRTSLDPRIGLFNTLVGEYVQ